MRIRSEKKLKSFMMYYSRAKCTLFPANYGKTMVLRRERNKRTK